MTEEEKHPLGKHAHEFEIQHDPNKKTINVPEASLTGPHKMDTDIEEELHARAARAEVELLNGFHAIRKFPKSVTFFGSARFPEEHPYYQKAKGISERICKEGFTVVTGGGPGIMQAGNHGAKETCGSSVGFNIELPMEQIINPYVTHGVNFHYFYTRKVTMFFSAEVYLYFPGGFGTLDEFFELVTLVQTNKMPKVPIILVGKDYWDPIINLCRELLLEKFETVSAEDFDLFTITDDDDEILEIVKSAPLRNEYK